MCVCARATIATVEKKYYIVCMFVALGIQHAMLKLGGGWETVESYLAPRMKIYGTWEFLYVEITQAKTQIVVDQHSSQALEKK